MTQQSEAAKATSEVLDVLAARFGTTAEHLWGVLVRQAGIEALQLVLGALAFAGAGAVLLWMRRRLKFVPKNDHSYDSYDTERMMGRLILAVIAAVLFGVALEKLLTLPTYLLNPEFAALRFVLDRLP